MTHVDVTGEVCPRPALIVRRELSDLEEGETLIVEGDYPPARKNLTRSCEKRGYDVKRLDSGENGSFELEITVTEFASIG